MGRKPGHKCDRFYCSKCHRGRVREARADGHKRGLERALEYLLAEQRCQRGIIEDILAHVRKYGSLEGDEEAARG